MPIKPTLHAACLAYVQLRLDDTRNGIATLQELFECGC